MDAGLKRKFARTFPIHTLMCISYGIRSILAPNGRKSVRRYGVEIDPFASVVSPTVREKIVKGRYEFVEAAIADNLVQKGDVVFEAGSGLGFLAAYLSGRIGEHGRFIGYEADPDVAKAAQDNLSRNAVRNAEVLNGAIVPSSDGTYSLSLEPDLWVRSLMPSRNTSPNVARRTVPQYEFNSLIEQLNPNVLIMDVEGLEHSLLIHAVLPAGLRAVILEIHPERLEPRQSEECLEMLLKSGFSVKFSFARVFGFEKTEIRLGTY
jgi:FkbM family methyltransferase